MTGHPVRFYADNKMHIGVCLAVLEKEILVEYRGASRCNIFTAEVVSTSSKMKLGKLVMSYEVKPIKTYTYRSLPKKWLQVLLATGQTWKGIERGGTKAPSPKELLEAKS